MKKKYLKIPAAKKIYTHKSISVDNDFILKIINESFRREVKNIVGVNEPLFRKIYATNKKEDSEGYSDYHLGTKKFNKEKLFVEETEFFPFKIPSSGNPYKDPKINIHNKTEIEGKFNGENKKLYFYDINSTYCSYEYMIKNLINQLKRKLKSKYEQNFKGILILTERMYLEFYVWIAPQSKRKYITLQEKNHSYIEQLVEMAIYKIWYDLKKEISLEEINNSQFDFIYIVFNFYGKLCTLPMRALYEQEYKKHELSSSISFEIKGKADPIINGEEI